MSICAEQPQSAGFVSSVVRYIDCQADGFAVGSWQALAQPGSTLSIVLGGFLTLFIAFIGYNLLLGSAFTVRSGTVALVKVGGVLALATSWPAYQTLVYDVVTEAPSQLFAEMTRSPPGIPAGDSALLARLDGVDAAMAQLAVLGAGYAGPAAAGPASPQTAPPPFAGFNAFALGGSRILFLLTAIASLGIVRLVAALVLALGPLLVAFLLFDNTRSLFEGWVRVLAGAALAGLAARVVITFQLSMMEPWLSAVLASRQSDQALPAIPVELLVIVTLFALGAVVLLMASARVAKAFRLAPVLQAFSHAGSILPVKSAEQVAARSSDVRGTTITRPSASSAIVRSARNREAVFATRSLDGQRRTAAAPLSMVKNAQLPERRTSSLGRSFRGAGRRRTSASAVRRDSIS